MYDATLRIIILGDFFEERQALFEKFLTNLFVSDKTMTIGVDFKVKSLIVDGLKVKLQIYDFGGEERFRFLLHQYCKSSNGAIIMYDITNRLSLDHLPDWTQIIREHAGDIPIILVLYLVVF